ncbi:hypothetical protein I4U23_013110 [Adineta vaga]|nr:hypothetical protein I4U23_013110 [Adineta vaga]
MYRKAGETILTEFDGYACLEQDFLGDDQRTERFLRLVPDDRVKGLDCLARNEIFTNTLSFASTDGGQDSAIDETKLNRFCDSILPEIHNDVKSLVCDAKLIDRILRAGVYLNLTQLKITGYLDNTFPDICTVVVDHRQSVNASVSYTTWFKEVNQTDLYQLRMKEPTIVVFGEFTGLKSAFIGTRGQRARTQSGTIQDAFLSMIQFYERQMTFYSNKYSNIPIKNTLELALSDVIWRAFDQTDVQQLGKFQTLTLSKWTRDDPREGNLTKSQREQLLHQYVLELASNSKLEYENKYADSVIWIDTKKK